MDYKELKHVGYVIFRNKFFTLKDGEKIKTSMELEDCNKRIYHYKKDVLEALSHYKLSIPDCDWKYCAVYAPINSIHLLPRDS